MEKKAHLNGHQTTAADTKPGASVDVADNDRRDHRLEKQDTEMLNNNPRNNDM